jgi:hypothetical protein
MKKQFPLFTCPEVADPLVHRKYRSIVGCLSYLVNMTRPDLAFSFSQLSKFLQCPGDAHLAAAYPEAIWIVCGIVGVEAPDILKLWVERASLWLHMAAVPRLQRNPSI